MFLNNISSNAICRENLDPGSEKPTKWTPTEACSTHNVALLLPLSPTKDDGGDYNIKRRKKNKEAMVKSLKPILSRLPTRISFLSQVHPLLK